MAEAEKRPAREAAKKILLPFLEYATYIFTGIALFAALYLNAILATEAPQAGIQQTLGIWSYRVLHGGFLAIGFLLGFTSLVFLPVKKKIIVVGLMILLGFLTRGLI